MSISKISRFAVWICKKFSRQEIEKIIAELNAILKNPHSEVKPKDEFEAEHPNYRNFDADPNAALTESEMPESKKKRRRKRKKTTR
jgi:hypothetical protein